MEAKFNAKQIKKDAIEVEAQALHALAIALRSTRKSPLSTAMAFIDITGKFLMSSCQMNENETKELMKALISDINFSQDK